MSGNLFDSAVMKISVIDADFRKRFLSDPAHPNVFEGKAIVFEGPEDYHARIEDPDLGVEEHVGADHPQLRPGRLSRQRRGGEHAAARPLLLKRGIDALPTMGDGRQIRHVRQPVDPQRLAGSGGRRRPRAAADRRPRSASTSTPARWTCCSPRANWPPAAPRGRARSCSTRRRGRRSTAAWSASSAPAPAWSRRRSTSTSSRRAANPRNNH